MIQQKEFLLHLFNFEILNYDVKHFANILAKKFFSSGVNSSLLVCSRISSRFIQLIP